jgi:transcription initiation factor TFIID subunit 11
MWYEAAFHKNCLISALDVMETQGEAGPVQPKHLREAVRRLRLRNAIPNGHPRRLWFRI